MAYNRSTFGFIFTATLAAVSATASGCRSNGFIAVLLEGMKPFPGGEIHQTKVSTTL